MATACHTTAYRLSQ